MQYTVNFLEFHGKHILKTLFFFFSGDIMVNKKLFLILAFALVVLQQASAADNIAISEILYDPINSESGGEAIELYNPLNQSIDISGWVIETEASANDVVFPDGTIIQPYSFYLITDIGWNQSKDNISWPEADLENTITLYNQDSYIILKLNESPIDTVGWGNDSSFFEGAPHEHVMPGQSLERRPGYLSPQDGNYIDTDNNADDFLARPFPDFQNSMSDPEIPDIQEEVNESPENNNDSVDLIANIGNVAPLIVEIVFLTDDDELMPGAQITPVPGGIKNISLLFYVTDYNGYEDIEDVSMLYNNATYTLNFSQNHNETTNIYEGGFYLDYYDLPMNYSLQAVVSDRSNESSNSSAYFVYNSLLAMEFDASAILFDVVPGQSQEILGDLEMNTTNSTTIRNLGNVETDIMLSATNLTSGQSPDILTAENIQYSFLDNDYESDLAGVLSGAGQVEDVNLVSGMNALRELTLKLNAPLGIRTGNYQGTLSLIAVES